MGRKVLATAAVAVFAIVALHGQGGQGVQNHTANGLKPGTVLFDAASSLGMLRSNQYRDLIITQEYWATGSLTRDGQTSKITDLRLSLDYPEQAMRLDFTREGPGGKPVREIQVVAGNFAWNETTPGGGGTPAPAAVRERLVQLWTTPMGIVKAAVAGVPIRRSVRKGPSPSSTSPSRRPCRMSR
jgi:hypothetical protein